MLNPINNMHPIDLRKQILKKNIKDLVSATTEIHNKVVQNAANCIENPKQGIINILSEAAAPDDAKLVKKSEKFTKPVVSIINTSLDVMSESKNPIIKKNAEFVKAHPSINLANIITNVQEIVNENVKNTKDTVNNITDEVAKNVVKKKIKNKFVDIITKFIAKIKNTFTKLYKIL